MAFWTVVVPPVGPKKFELPVASRLAPVGALLDAMVELTIVTLPYPPTPPPLSVARLPVTVLFSTRTMPTPPSSKAPGTPIPPANPPLAVFPDTVVRAMVPVPWIRTPPASVADVLLDTVLSVRVIMVPGWPSTPPPAPLLVGPAWLPVIVVLVMVAVGPVVLVILPRARVGT